tara:strand:+ start:189 stop:1391 length:1203 start_codon:yes stop_codon:yes gene_type:complete
MFSFGQYLTEANTHLVHLEDLSFEGSKRVQEAVNFLEELLQMLSGNASGKINTTVKWDGAPAIVCGINPENKKFFVGSKSVFNKTPKINYSLADIRKNHGTKGVAKKLATALKYLPKLGIKGIYQGDMMFGPGDIKSKTIDGVKYITFTPNTITYAVPLNGILGKRIVSAKMGIIFHTEYTGKDMKSLSASFSPKTKTLRKTKDVWFDDASYKDASGNATLTSNETEKLNKTIKGIKRKLNSVSSFLDVLKGDTKLVQQLNIFVNAQIRKGESSLSSAEFVKWMNDKMQGEIDALKSEAGKERKELARKETMDYIKSKSKEMNSLFSLHSALSEAKMFLIRKLEQIKNMDSFIQTPTGFKVTKPEGFVAVDKLSNKAVKLVDRLEFSRANFNAPKNWIKG